LLGTIVRNSWPVSKFHTRTVLSLDPDTAIGLPSRTLTHRTVDVWPCIEWTRWLHISDTLVDPRVTAERERHLPREQPLIVSGGCDRAVKVWDLLSG
jgi:hypothetical protein